MKSLKWIPNSLTAARIFLTPIITYFIVHSRYGWALSLFCIAALTDFLDGFLARRWKAASIWGALFDPVADKILMFALLSALMIRGLCPSWFLGLLLSVHLIQALGFIVSNWPTNPFKVSFTVLRIAKWNTTLQLLWIGVLILSGHIGLGGGALIFTIGRLTLFISLSVLQIAVFLGYFFHFRIHLSPDFKFVFPTPN